MVRVGLGWVGLLADDWLVWLAGMAG